MYNAPADTAATGPGLDGFADRHPVGIFPEPDQGEENALFEVAKRLRHG